MSHNPRDPMLPFGTDKCRCPTCGLYFNSTYAFDEHRNADHIPGKRPAVTDRRCRSVDQLKALGCAPPKRGTGSPQHGRLVADPRSIILPREDVMRRSVRAQRIATFLSGLDPRRPWEVVVRPFKRSRSNQQNRYERGVACKLLSEATGYEADEIHEYLVGTYFGWRQVRCPKTPSNPSGLRDVPVRTTTTNDLGQRDVLSKSDYSDFIAFVQRFGAKHGVLIPEPDPDFALKAEREEKAA